MPHVEAILEWYADMGVDVAVIDTPVDWFEESKRLQRPPLTTSPNVSQRRRQKGEPMRDIPGSQSNQSSVFNSPPPRKTPALGHQQVADDARALAEACDTIEALENAVRQFEGCGLKKTATNTVFSDGTPKADVMLIGEAPGYHEDQQGIPFCGPSGKLLDKMLAAIGLTRAESVYISNALFWRPPGNRTPSPEEIAICRPFVERHIALMRPKLLILAGSTATRAILDTPLGISRLRGKRHTYTNRYLEDAIPVAVFYHPSYLLRQPSQKRLAWHDLLEIKVFLEGDNDSK